MRYLKLITFFLLIFSNSFINLNAGLVYFANIRKKQCGFIAKTGDDYYAYTSQTALLSLGRFAIMTFDGTIIKPTGPLELSYFSDIARMKVDPGNRKDQVYEMGGRVTMGSEVQVFSISIADNIDSKSHSNVEGIGMHAFAFDIETDDESAGTPVLSSDDKVVGVLSKGHSEFEISSHWNEGKIKVVKLKNKQAARLDVKIKWVSSTEVDFRKASVAIADATKFQTDFLPLLNWWCANPYRILSDGVKYPKELKPWVNDNNYKTKIYDRLIAKCEKAPIKNKGLMDTLTDSTVERGLKLANFAQSKLRQMTIRWKTPFLRSIANHYKVNWRKINKMMDRRIGAMEFLLPFSHKSKPEKSLESNNKKKTKKKKK